MSLYPSLNLADTHCHLNFDAFDDDRTQVLERARRAGVSKILIPGIDIETSKSALKYSIEVPGLFASVGIHPNSGMTWESDSLRVLQNLVRGHKVVAIGEIGLDYYRDHTPKKIQRDIFLQQLELAAELDLPVIIHNRDASDEIVEILQDWHQKLAREGSKLALHPGVMHSFSADVQVAEKIVAMRFKIGVTGPVTFRNSQVLQSVIASLPLESVVIETDAPYLAPQPYRGKRNEPANVRIVAEKIAELKNCPVDEVAKITTKSAEQLFDWSEIH